MINTWKIDAWKPVIVVLPYNEAMPSKAKLNEFGLDHLNTSEGIVIPFAVPQHMDLGQIGIVLSRYLQKRGIHLGDVHFVNKAPDYENLKVTYIGFHDFWPMDIPQ